MQFEASPNNYTLGRGQLFFARFLPGTKSPGPEVYFGNTPDFKINTTSETLEHFSSEAGVKEVDDSATLKTTRKLTLKTDNVSPSNLALLFLGSAEKLTAAARNVVGEVIAGARVAKDAMVSLGVTATDLVGAMNVTEGTVVVHKGAALLVEGTDYEVIYASGLLHILPGGSVSDGDALTVSYDTALHTRDVVISGSSPIIGQLRFISENAAGKDSDYLLPYVRLSPNGEFALKGDTWQEIDFQGDVLKLTPATPAVTVNGRTFLA